MTVEEAVPGIAGESDSLPDTVAWAEQYCRFASLTPCTGIEDRGVPLCIEKWDCHPALLVTFREGTAAFLHGGIFPDPLVFAVWRPESDPAVAEHGGGRAILEAYLLTLGVCEDESDRDPRGRDCPMILIP